MYIHYRTLLVVLFIEGFCKSVIIHAIHRTPIKSVRMERILFTMKVSCENMENIKNRICELFKEWFELNLLPQIQVSL